MGTAYEFQGGPLKYQWIRLSNTSAESVTNDAADRFIGWIQTERREWGFGFLPLVGAGFSSGSAKSVTGGDTIAPGCRGHLQR
jgi:hypothetical protein